MSSIWKSDKTPESSFTQNDGEHIATDEVRARDGDGLKLHDDGGKGILVTDGGNTEITGNIRVDKTSINASVIANRTDGKSAALSAGEFGSLFLYDNSGSFAIKSQDGADVIAGIAADSVTRLIVDATGLGIGTGAPGNPLAVNRSADGIIVDFESADTVEGNVSIADNTTSYNAFVGSHYTQLKDGQKELPVGAVVVSTGEIIPCEANIEKEIKEEIEVEIKDAFENIEFEENGEQIGEEFDKYVIKNEKVIEVKKPIYKKIKKIKRQLKANHALDSKTGKIIKTITTKQNVAPDVTNKEYFTFVNTTNQVADKAVYGVWLGKMSDDAKEASFGQDNKPVYLIAQVGLFKILVCEDGGNIEVGDYIETSIHPMLAQKQSDNIKANSSVAKAMIAVDWSKEQINLEFGLKVKLIPCIF